MTTCASCGRSLTRPQWVGGKAYGSVCVREVAPMQRAAAAVKQGRRRRAKVRPAAAAVPGQLDFFAEDLGYAQRVDALLSNISLEMPNA